MKAPIEEFFDLRTLEGDRLKLSFVVVVEEGQSLSSICRNTQQLHVTSILTLYTLPSF